MSREIAGLRLLSDNYQSLPRTLLLYSLLLTVFLSGIYLFYPKYIEVFNLKVTDIILGSVAAPEPQLDIITVAIDDASVEKYGQWPWPRYRVARLLDKIVIGGAKSIGIDVIFAERDRTSPKLWQETLKNDFGYEVDTSAIPATILDHDQYLANTLAKGPFVLGYSFLFGNNHTTLQKCRLPSVSLPPRAEPGTNAKTKMAATAAALDNFHRADGVLCNFALLSTAASGAGFLNGTPDIDGVLRRLPLLIEYKDQFYPSFSLAILSKFQDQQPRLGSLDGTTGNSVLLGRTTIPTDGQGNILLGPPTNVAESSRLSAGQLLEDQIKPDFFKDKIVLVGLTAAGLTRKYSTPLGPPQASIDLHRQALESLNRNTPTQRTELFSFWETGVSLLLSLSVVASVAYFQTFGALLFCLFSIGLCCFGANSIYQTSGFLFSPLLPILTVGLNSCLLLSFKFYYFQQQAKTETGETVLLLKSSESNLQSILNTIPDIVFRLDTEGNIIFISPAIAKYINPDSPLLGHSILELVAPEDLEKSQYQLHERRTGERATTDLEIRLLLTRKNNEQEETRRYFSLSTEGIYQPSSDGTPQFLGTQGIFRDITQRKRLEHQLIQAQKMEAIGNLASGIAHDLNNILSGLVSYPDLLLLEIPQEDPLHKKIQVIQKSGKKAAIIVQDLLTLARRSITIDEICCFNQIISDFLESIEFQRQKDRHSNTSIQLELQERLPNIKGSAAHLSKVIMNILHNALEAMPAGGEIVITTETSYLESSLTGYEEIPKGEYVHITIADSGVGIPEEDLKRIFEPFYTKKSMHLSGSGLGMTVVWATIKDHHGFIDIKSQEGKGTTFEFYLPTTKEDANVLQRRIVLDDYLGSESILIVDDIPEQLHIAQNLLTKLGYKTYVAASGEDALQIIRSQPVDLVILDMIMPGGMDGLETYQEIIRIYPGQKAIITSGFSESDRANKLLQLGAGKYVKKPYSMEKLGMAVRGELDRRNN